MAGLWCQDCLCSSGSECSPNCSLFIGKWIECRMWRQQGQRGTDSAAGHAAGGVQNKWRLQSSVYSHILRNKTVASVQSLRISLRSHFHMQLCLKMSLLSNSSPWGTPSCSSPDSVPAARHQQQVGQGHPEMRWKTDSPGKNTLK